jgi:hypothetical protein
VLSRSRLPAVPGRLPPGCGNPDAMSRESPRRATGFHSAASRTEKNRSFDDSRLSLHAAITLYTTRPLHSRGQRRRSPRVSLLLVPGCFSRMPRMDSGVAKPSRVARELLPPAVPVPYRAASK